MEGAQVLEFQMTYPKLTKKLKDNSPSGYDLGLTLVMTEEYNKGFKVDKINSPNRSGTKVTYKPIESDKEANEYRQKLIDMANEAKKGLEEQIDEKIADEELKGQIKMEV